MRTPTTLTSHFTMMVALKSGRGEAYININRENTRNIIPEPRR
jgi:hypothetical protein